jgi:hypothetical protein
VPESEVMEECWRNVARVIVGLTAGPGEKQGLLALRWNGLRVGSSFLKSNTVNYGRRVPWKRLVHTLQMAAWPRLFACRIAPENIHYKGGLL